jgi:valyl-tRNA synthetase
MNEINEEFKKPYNPTEHEDLIYKKWEDSGFFNPDVCIEKGVTKKDAPCFTVSLPPPNATGILHLGHALEDSLQDTAVRFARMQGKKTLWIPGTDHAAIATNTKVEKIMIKEEGKNRHDVGRENFIERVEKYVEASRGTIQKQIRRMGASCDWSREAFTFDEKRITAVNTAFKKMYDAGLIYRGYRVINWDPKGQTTVSNDEVLHKPEKGKIYTFRYSKDFPIPIATTRPETKVGDTAIAVHPDDARYKSFIGKEFKNISFAGAVLNIKIIADTDVDSTYGTGAVGVTPAHSLIDAEMATKNNLPMIQVIDEYARMTEQAGPLVAGKKVKEAREFVVNWLKENDLLEKEEDTEINMSIADRSGGTIEPLPKLQWFVNVSQSIKERQNKTLKELMWEPVEKGEIQITPDRFEKIYHHWITNLRDWCISRQLWYGHKIPVWYKDEEIYCGLEAPKGSEWKQDEDTLDTWFSSALWTFSTLGWPEETSDLKNYHPTDLMAPGYEILPLWVARMILMSQFLLGEIPFCNVYLHGILRDKKGQKFSKSLGNGIDPIEIIDKYGADALRMSLIVGIGPGNDANFDEQKVKAYKNFANKIWNIARFVLENSPKEAPEENFLRGPLRIEKNKKYVEEFESLVKDVTSDMENYRFYLAAEKLYHYTWHTFADIIIEESKKNEETKKILLPLLREQLKMLHPFMPFITEKIWSMLPACAGRQHLKGLLMVEKWPLVNLE